MDMPKVTETIPEQSSEATAGVEATPIAEVISNTPTPPPPVSSLDANQGSILDPGSFVTTQDDDSVNAVEIADLNSSDVEKADQNWTGRVRDVIKADAGQPAKEETDAEALNEDYMKSRFNVDVDAPIEEK